MLEAASSFKTHQLIITAAPNIPDEVYASLTRGYEVTLISGKTYDVLQQAEAAILASGTVSLEAGVIRCPQVVCYRMAGGAVFFGIGQKILKIRWVSLVNLILQREAVRELLQHHCTVRNIREELQRILFDPGYREKIWDQAAGSIIVESIFSIDGMGKLAVEAVKGRDRELVLSITLISGVLTLLGYLLADLLYALADPRVSYE